MQFVARHPAGQPRKTSLENSRYLGTADLAKRWGYTTRGVRNLIQNEIDFPAPAFTVNEGRIRIWTLPTIEAWETVHPETKSADAKRQKTLYPATFRRIENLPRSRAKARADGEGLP
jgi:hypothetical protein